MKDNSSKPVIPLPFPVYFWTFVGLAIMGLADAIYLSISHYRVYTDIGYASFCAISKAINCDTVSQSPYSILWGAPVPVLGGLWIFMCSCSPAFCRIKRSWKRANLAFSVLDISGIQPLQPCTGADFGLVYSQLLHDVYS
jgi:uncharacterized membrane protein